MTKTFSSKIWFRILFLIFISLACTWINIAFAAPSLFEHEEIFNDQGDLIVYPKNPHLKSGSINPAQVPIPVMVNPRDLTPTDNTRVNKIIDQHIYPHMQQSFKGKIVAKIKKFAQKIAIGEPMSAETRALLVKSSISVIKFKAKQVGIPLNENTLRGTLDKLFLWSSKFGVYPQAISVGGMARYQDMIGGSFGYQFNLYIDQGDVILAGYQQYGVQAGLADQKKIQFYASLCFGACTGGDAQGFYVGLDGGADFGPGSDFFVEGGFDLTDMLFHNDGSYSAKDFYQSKAIYVGIGGDIGFGGGVSVNGFYYSLDFERTLVPHNRLVSDEEISKMIKD